MSEPLDDSRTKYDGSPEPEKRGLKPNNDQSIHVPAGHLSASGGVNDLSFPHGPCLSEDDDELTESKIKAFLDVKVIFFIAIKSAFGSSFALKYYPVH